MELARSLELRSGAYRAPALPVELYQRSWRGDSNADHGLTRPALFPLSYTSTKLLCDNLEAVGRIALPLVCFAGRCLAVLATPPRTYLLTWSGRRDSNPRSRRWQRRVLATRRLPPGASSESRTRVIGLEARGTSRYTMLALQTGRGDRIRTCLNSFWRRAPFPSGHHPYGGRNGS